jgi:hypothetical protein
MYWRNGSGRDLTRPPDLNITENIGDVLSLKIGKPGLIVDESSGCTYVHSGDSFRFNKIGDVGSIVYTSTLIPKASTVPRTPRHYDIIYVSGIFGLCGPRILRNRKRGNLEVPLHEWQYERM